MSYCPSRDHWQAGPPAELGLSADALAAAIDYHRAHETTWRRDLLTGAGRYIGVADEPPPDNALGPVEPRPGQGYARATARVRAARQRMLEDDNGIEAAVVQAAGA